MEFNRDRHIKYWRMNANILPDHYIPTDSSRMTLGFFIVAALDLLDLLPGDERDEQGRKEGHCGADDDDKSKHSDGQNGGHKEAPLMAVHSETKAKEKDKSKTKISQLERQSWIDWIYACQHPRGGFRGSTGTDVGSALSSDSSSSDSSATNRWDPASVPATFFALAALLVLGDDMSRVNREGCMSWLPRLQREDGSFGEVLIEDSTADESSSFGKNDNDNDKMTSVIEGGTDLRFCCCAAGIAYILQGNNDGLQDTTTTTTSTQADTADTVRRAVITKGDEIINTTSLTTYIQSCQSDTDGGYGESPFKEPHSGLTYCAVAALAFVQLLRGKRAEEAGDIMTSSESVVRWMVERQTSVLEEEEEEEDDEDDDNNHNEEEEEEEQDEDDPNTNKHQINKQSTASRPVRKLEDFSLQKSPSLILPLADSDDDTITAGFNGRQGKIADTCYCFWNMGALAILKSDHLINTRSMKKYLLTRVQHGIGGFGKGIGAPPDILHSYLGLAALALTLGPDPSSSSAAAAAATAGPGPQDREKEDTIKIKIKIKPVDPTLCISLDAAARITNLAWKQ